MEKKKTDRTNLEKKRVMFLQTGVLASLAVCLIAFEWTTVPNRDVTFKGTGIDGYFEEEMVNTFRKKKENPMKPPTPEPLDFTIRSNDVQLEDEFLDWDSEYDPFEKMNIDMYDVPEEKPEEDVFTIVEDMPTFENGGLSAFARYVNRNLKYPSVAAEHGIEGKVFIQFIVNEKGNVTDVNTIRGTDPVLDSEAMRVVQGSPQWIPGRQRGMPVKVRFVIPVNFKLN